MLRAVLLIAMTWTTLSFLFCWALGSRARRGVRHKMHGSGVPELEFNPRYK